MNRRHTLPSRLALALTLGIALPLTTTACEHAPMVQADEVLGAPGSRQVGAYNVQGNLALEGHDPVSYWPEGGGLPILGSADRSVEYRGIVYFFANDENLATFKRDPDRYEPAHGGWCSYAMADGSAVEVDPKTFLIRDDRLFLFYNEGNTDTRALWEEGDHSAQVEAADSEWSQRLEN